MKNLKKLTLAGVLIAVAVICSAFYIPVGASKCFPIQHLVNVLAGVILGPWYAVGMAFATSFIRLMMGTGSLLAFPGSMVGALLCGLLYQWKPNLGVAFFGETFGTGILGGMLAYPVAALVMGKEAALFTYVVPFLVSTLGGSIFAVILLFALKRTQVFNKIGI